MRVLLPLLLICAALPPCATGQALDADQLEALADQHAPTSFSAFRDLLRLPNDAHDPEQIARNLAWMERAFAERGFAVETLATGGPPLLLAEREAEGGAPTVLVYLQIDGQPVDSSQWDQASPYEPVLKRRDGSGWREIPWERLEGDVDPEWRIFARSASDAKGPAMALLTALDAMEAEGLTIPYNLKVIMDFEEEQGSPHLPEAVRRHRDRLAADALIIFDGPRHVTNRPTLTFGARGIATVTLTVFGPRVPQHSGHYGNYVPNPAFGLARLLASMKDERGRVVLPGFYDGVEIDSAARAVLAEVPDDEEEIRRELGIAEAEGVAATLQEALQYPSLNVRGMAAGWVGDEVRTIIPDRAVAELDVRLVPESDPERLIGLVREHVRSQGYHLVDGEPTDDERARYAKLASFESRVSYGAFRTPVDSDVGTWLTGALGRAFGEAPIRKRISGGSIPIAPFVVTLGVPAVTVPTVNPDNNQHSPNENLRVGNYTEAVQTFLAILTEPLE